MSSSKSGDNERSGPPRQQAIIFSKHATAGVVSGIVGTLVGYPFDICKTHMQASGRSNLVGTMQGIYRQQGIRGFYNGVIAPLSALTILGAQTFPLFVFFDQQVFHNAWIAGFCCGPFSATVSTPFELLKIQLALSDKATAAFPAALKVLRSNPFYGHGINTLRESVFLSIYFGCYTNLKTSLPVPIAGAIAGASSWFVSYPLDCVKTRVQKCSLPASTVILRLLSSSASNGGLGVLYSGLFPSILRAAVVSAVRFSSYEAGLWAFSPLFSSAPPPS